MKRIPIHGAAAEFTMSALGDRRLDRRLAAISKRAVASPGASFPKMLPSSAEREAFYRFVENDRVKWGAIVEPHHAATAERCRAATSVCVAHDTTWFGFGGEREGLGPISRNKLRGYAGHISLAVSADERRSPLGVLALSAFVRADKPLAKTKLQRAAARQESRLKRNEGKESARWMAGVRSAAARVGADVTCIHVMDQEADNFALLADLVSEDRRFVIRGSVARRLDAEGRQNVDNALAKVTAKLFRTVPLNARAKSSPGHPQRSERDAVLKIRGLKIALPRPTQAQSTTKKLHLHVVQVFEPDPPEGLEAIEWVLYTTEPIDTAEELATVVDHYRARWRIEEYFKALKTGCAFEKRQLTTFAALQRALALLIPIAWHLLAIRTVARDSGTRPVADILDDVQVQVLRVLAPSSKLPSRPTARDAMLAIADVGGHVRQNGEPGWLVLGRGYEDLVKAEMVWRAALRRRTQK